MDETRPVDRDTKIPASPFLGLLRVTRGLSLLRTQGAGVLPWLLVGMLALVIAYYVWPRPKSFFLDLTTDYLRIETDSDTQIVWELPSLRICLPRHAITSEQELGDVVDTSIASCNGLAYLELQRDFVELDWPPGLNLELRSGENRAVDVVVRFDEDDEDLTPVMIGDVEIVSETLLRIPASTFSEFGGLGLTGQLVVGQKADNGTVKLLRAGKFETREKFWLRNDARLVDSGALSLGDVVSVERMNPDAPLSAYAFLTLDAKGEGMRLIVSTEEAFSRLRLDRARAKATFLEPSWAQRLARDPLAIGFASLLSLFGATLAVMNALLRKRP